MFCSARRVSFVKQKQGGGGRTHVEVGDEGEVELRGEGRGIGGRGEEDGVEEERASLPNRHRIPVFIEREHHNPGMKRSEETVGFCVRTSGTEGERGENAQVEQLLTFVRRQGPPPQDVRRSVIRQIDLSHARCGSSFDALDRRVDLVERIRLGENCFSDRVGFCFVDASFGGVAGGRCGTDGGRGVGVGRRRIGAVDVKGGFNRLETGGDFIESNSGRRSEGG
jgi:hypothetical protein